MNKVMRGLLFGISALLSVFATGAATAREPVVSADQLRAASVVGLAELAGQGVAVGLAVEDDARVVAIFIGMTEGAAIARALNGIRPPRPMTHDLLGDVLEATGARIRQVVIDDLRDGIYYATLQTETADGRTVWIDARPSDSIALAARRELPILVSPAVLASAPDWSGPDGRPPANARIIDTGVGGSCRRDNHQRKTTTSTGSVSA